MNENDEKKKNKREKLRDEMIKNFTLELSSNGSEKYISMVIHLTTMPCGFDFQNNIKYIERRVLRR